MEADLAVTVAAVVTKAGEVQVVAAHLTGDSKASDIRAYLDERTLAALQGEAAIDLKGRSAVRFETGIRAWLDVDVAWAGSGRSSPGTAYDPPSCDAELTGGRVFLESPQGRRLDITAALPANTVEELLQEQFQAELDAT